jgi:hypothetical protein
MTIANLVRAAVVSSVVIVAMLAGSLRADEPKTQPTSAPTDSAVTALEGNDKAFAAEVDAAYAVVVFPKVGGDGEDSGRGQIIVGGKVVGRAMAMSSGVGIDAGTAYAELILIENKKTLDSILDSGLKLDESVSATALTENGKATVKYKGGIAVFVKNENGGKTDRSVAGQQIIAKAQSE